MGAEALLQQLLREALDPSQSPEVLATLNCLPRGELPLFVQLQAGGVPEVVVQGGGIVPGVSAGAFSQQNGDSADDQEALGAQGAQAVGEAGLKEVLRSAGFQQFAEYVLERALMGLVEESVAGEWESAQ